MAKFTFKMEDFQDSFKLEDHFPIDENDSVFDMLPSDISSVMNDNLGSQFTKIEPVLPDEQEEELDVVGIGYTPETFQTKNIRSLVGRPPAKRKLQMDWSNLGVDVSNTVGFKTPSPPKIKKKPAKSPKATKSPSEKSRYETSLGLLTKRFVALLKSAPDGVLDLNKAAEELSVQKRRIYDITNVLEGIKLISKRQKNNIEWRGSSVYTAQEPSSNNPMSEEVKNLTIENNNLAMQEKQLDDLLRSASLQLKMLTEEPQNKRYAYVTYDDIRGIRSFDNHTIVTIKAPPETKLEVPDPNEGIQIWLKSTRGPIICHLCGEGDKSSDDESEDKENEMSSPKSSTDPALKVNNLEDDLTDLGRNLLLTDDQNSAFPDVFFSLSPPATDDYPFALEDHEGISDLFNDFLD